MAGVAAKDETKRGFGALRGLEKVTDLNLNMLVAAVGREDFGSCCHLFKHLAGERYGARGLITGTWHGVRTPVSRRVLH